MIDVVAAAIVDGDRVLAALRGPAMKTPNRWEFPGGKVERGESPESALVREIREELGAEIEVGVRLGEAIVPPIRLILFRATLRRGPPSATEHAALAWVGPAELDGLDWADADVPLLAAVHDTLRP